MLVLSISEFLAGLATLLAGTAITLAGWLGVSPAAPPASSHWQPLRQQMHAMPGSEGMMEACAKAMADMGVEGMSFHEMRQMLEEMGVEGVSADGMRRMMEQMEGAGMRRMMEGVGPGMPGMPMSSEGMGSMMQGTGPGTTGMMARMMMGMMGGMMPSGMMGGR